MDRARACIKNPTGGERARAPRSYPARGVRLSSGRGGSSAKVRLVGKASANGRRGALSAAWKICLDWSGSKRNGAVKIKVPINPTINLSGPVQPDKASKHDSLFQAQHEQGGYQ